MLILMMMLGVRLVIGSEISWQGMELGLDGFGIMTDHIHFQMCEMSEVYDS